MKNEAKTKSVKLSSLMDSKKQEIQIPKGTIAEHDVSDGPFIFSGNLKNEGTLRVLGSKTSTVEMVFGQILNKGLIECEAGTLSLASSEFSNHGEIKALSKVRLRATAGKLSVDGKSGSISAETSILLRADGGLKVDGGTYTAGSIQFQAKDGKVSVIAEALEGEVEVAAVSANVGTKSGQLDLGQQKLLSGNHVYYNYSGNVSVGGVSHGADPVTILASGNVSASSVAGGEVTIAAGVYFTINGEYPDPTEDSNADVSWEITSSYGYGNIDITGSLTANNATLLGSEVTIGGTVDVTQDLDITTPSPGGGTVEFSGTVTATNATLAAFDVTFSDELTLSENLDIQSAFENGTVLFSADVDIDGDATIIASQIDFEGDDFDIDGVLEMGNSYQGAYINLAGTFTASDDVTFNAYQTKFDGMDFTMDGQDKVLNANSSTRIEASGTIAIDADVETDHAVNLQFYCDGDIKTGSITIDNSQGNWAGGLCIKTNRSGSSSEFIIGGSSNSNGVNGQIITDTVSGGSTDSTSYSYGCVYISNGGTGGITLANAGDISVKGTSSRSGGITLDAGDGDISLPAGTLSADGTGDHGGSFIQLFADTIETEDGTVISASDNGQSGQQKLVQIAANTVNLTGSTGLTIRSDGDGNAANPTSLQILPKDSIVLDDNDSITNFYYWFTAEDNYWNGADSVEFAGSATAPLNISSNGSHNRVYASAYPLTFNTGETNIECKGEEDHQIDIVRFQASGSAGLVFNGDDVTIDASGPDSGSGDGGQISINIDYISRSSTGKVTVKADGKGDGDGGYIIFYPGAVSSAVQLGLDDEQFAFSAKGGSTSGNGGQVELWGWSASIAVYDAGLTSTPIDVSAPGTDGDGGQIDIVAYGSNGLTFDGTASYIKADSGLSSGSGGRITILASNAPITIDTGSSGAVSLSAVSNGDGDGGTIDVTCWAGLSVKSANLAVTADGDGTGGTINLSAGYSTLSIDGNLNADGGIDDSNGGIIDLEGGQISLAAGVNTTLSANGNGTGNGGLVSALTHWAALTIGGNNQELSLNAKSNDSGSGGTINLESQTDIVVDADAISVAAGPNGNGNGGAIYIDSDTSISIEEDLVASGFGTGSGGLISITTEELTIEDAAIYANGGTGGDGGTITVEYSASAVESLQIGTLSATGGSENGGNITINNKQAEKMTLYVNDAIDTHAGPSLAGLTTFEPTGNNDVSVTILSGGNFNSIISVECKIFTFFSNEVAEVGLKEITAQDKIEIDAYFEGSFITVPDDESAVVAVNSIDIDTPTFINSGNVTSKAIKIGLSNSDIDEFQITNGGTITGTNGGTADILIGSSSETIMDGNGEYQSSGGMQIVSDGNITTNSDLDVTVGQDFVLLFDTYASLLTAEGGVVRLNNNVDLHGTGDTEIQFNVALLINDGTLTNASTSSASGVKIFTTNTAVQNVRISGTGSIVAMYVNCIGNAGFEGVQSSLTQPNSGNPSELVGSMALSSIPGYWTFEITDGGMLLGNISCAYAHINVEASGDLNVKSGAAIYCSAPASSKDIVLLAGSGNISIGSGAELQAATGSVFISSPPQPTAPYTAGSAPVSNIGYGSGSSASVYWGTSGVTANGQTNTLDAQNSKVIVFDATGIVLNGDVTINAGH